MKMITDIRDEKNRRIIALPFMGNVSAERERLLFDGTPEERDAFVKKQKKRIFIGLAIVGLLWFASTLMPKREAPSVPPPVIEAAGQIQDIQLHSTAFSTESTVQTTIGTYQVKGGVSSAKGESATLRREKYPVEKTLLCVESKIKAQCYQLM